MVRLVRPGVHLLVLAALLSVWRYRSSDFVTPRNLRRVARAAETQTKADTANSADASAPAAPAPPAGARATASFEEVKPGGSGEGMRKARQFLALEPLDDEVNQWEADMKNNSGLTAEEERKKWVAIISGAVTFALGGSYVLLNIFMDSTDWSGFAGEKTLSAEDLKLLGQ
mmetsp:Transcript_70600/g.111677  ORF Transcript_70600/g.111677 Transcript_70600/m.111677 type:complete len:171 (-) Transcript_70600:212-724(-)